MKVYTKRAAKDYPEYGISRGDTYYEWCHYRQKPTKSKTPPKESDLTADPDMAEAMRVFEGLDQSASYDCEDVRGMISTLEDCRDSLQGRLDGVPESLQDSSPLNEKIEQLEETISSMESLADDLEQEDDSDDDSEEGDGTCGADRIEEARAF